MLKFEKHANFVQHSNKGNYKNTFLEIIRSLASSGDFRNLISYIERTIPNVSQKLYNQFLFF